MLNKFFAFALFGLIMQPLAAKELPDFATLVEKYGATVVNVSTSQRGRSQADLASPA